MGMHVKSVCGNLTKNARGGKRSADLNARSISRLCQPRVTNLSSKTSADAPNNLRRNPAPNSLRENVRQDMERFRSRMPADAIILRVAASVTKTGKMSLLVATNV